MHGLAPLAAALLLATTAVAGLPNELASALKNFRADPPPGWSYLQTTAAEGQSTVERCDATKPEFDRWTLLEKDGRPPTPAESRTYFEARSRRSRGGTAPKLVEQLDAAHLEAIDDDGVRFTVRCRLKPAEPGDRTASHLRATVVVHRPTHTIESIELRNTEPFRPALGVKIAEMTSRLTYSLPDGETPSLPQRVETRLRGRAFWLKSLDAEMTIVFSAYERARRR